MLVYDQSVIHYMQLLEKEIFGESHRLISIVVALSFLLFPICLHSQDQLQDDQTPIQNEVGSIAIPTLSEIIPLEINLLGRLEKLNAEMGGLLMISQLEAEYDDFNMALGQPAVQLQQFKDTDDLRYSELFEFKKALEIYIESFEEISAPLLLAIEKTGSWQKEWMKEKDQWGQWQDSLTGKGELSQLEVTFANAHSSIDTALNLIIPQLGALLELQHEGYKNKAKLDSFEAEIDKMIQDFHQNLLESSSPRVLSSEFTSQFSGDIWIIVKRGFITIAWPDARFFAREIWVILLQLIVTLFVTAFIYWKRPVISGMKSYAFIARHPIAAGLFLGVMTTVVIYQLHNTPSSWNMIIAVIGGLSFARIVSAIDKSSWKTSFVYGVMMLLIITQLLDLMSFPLPLYRVFLVVVSIICLISCFIWAAKCRHKKADKKYSWWLYLISIVFLVIIIAEIAGDNSLATYLFASMLRTVITLLIFMMLMYLIRGGVEQVFSSTIHTAGKAEKNEIKSKTQQLVTFIYTVIIIFILVPAILALWGAYNNIQEANTGLMNIGFTLGDLRVSIGLFLTVAGILYGSYIFSIILQYSFTNKIMLRRKIDKGARLSINRLLHYFILFIAFILAIAALGLDVTKLTIVLSALGVGVGFGLQGVVNNFVSGLILLIERPIREGDSIQVAGEWSTIRKIGLRATRVRTADEADVIIPNADLVYNQVTNWTLRNRSVKLIIPVGVEYGSNVDLVIETMIEASKANENIVKDAVTQVLFMGFGESSLNFELRVWVSDAKERIQVISDLHRDIFRRFKEANIEIAFPQLDLHLRDVDKSVTFKKEVPDK